MRHRILIADDHQVVREGLVALVSREADMEVVGEAEDGHAALRLAAELSPHVVVLDIGMAGMNGIEAARAMAAACPSSRVLMLSMHAGARYVSEALKAGACGYVLKSCAFEELVRAIRTVAANQSYLSPTVARVVVDGYARPGATTGSSAHSVLSPRERQVLQLVSEGLATKQIALRLKLSPRTVDVHRTRIMDKLGIRSIAELTRYAIREGLTPLEG